MNSLTPQVWPFEQAALVQQRVQSVPKDVVVFETGYGPSGLPHMGTFAEVARTTWVRRAFEHLTGQNTKLIAFSDDMDALRKVPDNVPEQHMLSGYLGRSLSSIPDPWHTHDSYADHMNAELQKFLNQYGFEYEFVSSTAYYQNHVLDSGLLRMAECHDEICDLVKSTLQSERRATYSPFLPIHPVTGQVMQVRIQEVHAQHDVLVWQAPDTHEEYRTAITGGACKAQWKADWALRWYVLGVDYEMSGKDLIDSVKLSKKICRVLGAEPPVCMTYELFLDEHGHKISKSVGNGVSMTEWLRYAPAHSLCQFMFPNPGRARRIQVSQIPQTVDEYLTNQNRLVTNPDPVNPAWHILGAQPAQESDVSYQMILNLVNVLNATSTQMVMEFMQRYHVNVNITSNPALTELVQCAINYYEDHILPNRVFVTPTPAQVAAIQDLRNMLLTLDPDSTAEQIQYQVFEVGKAHAFDPLRSWFECLYQVLLGQTQGPRFGGFVHLYGIQNTVQLMDAKLLNHI